MELVSKNKNHFVFPNDCIEWNNHHQNPAALYLNSKSLAGIASFRYGGNIITANGSLGTKIEKIYGRSGKIECDSALRTRNIIPSKPFPYIGYFFCCFTFWTR